MCICTCRIGLKTIDWTNLEWILAPILAAAAAGVAVLEGWALPFPSTAISPPLLGALGVEPF